MKIKTMLTSVILAAITTGASAAKLDLNSPEGAVEAMRKIQCSTVDEKPIFYWWKGKAFSRRMGEADQHMFNVEGMNVRQCVTVDGGKKGKSFKLVTREILLYTDKRTGQPLKTWKNPWSGETVDVVHVTNDPVNQPVRFPFNEEGKPYPWTKKFAGDVMGGKWWVNFAMPLFYHNVLGGDYQKQIGGVYHATEMFNFFGDVDSLVDPKNDTAPAHVGWVRASDWLPWMMMSGREGIVYFHTAGLKVDGFDAMGPVMKEYINKYEPKYKTPPPVTDTRKNETSWSTYKDDVKGGRFKAVGYEHP